MSEDKRIPISTIWLLLTFVTLGASAFLLISPDGILRLMGFGFLAMSGIGLLLGVVVNGFYWDNQISISELFYTVVYGFLTFGLVAIAQFVGILLTGDVTLSVMQLLPTIIILPFLIGVSEELLFSYGFPYRSAQGGVIAFITLTLPSLGLSLWASSGLIHSEKLLKTLISFLVPAVRNIYLSPTVICYQYLTVALIPIPTFNGNFSHIP